MEISESLLVLHRKKKTAETNQIAVKLSYTYYHYAEFVHDT